MVYDDIHGYDGLYWWRDSHRAFTHHTRTGFHHSVHVSTYPKWFNLPSFSSINVYTLHNVSSNIQPLCVLRFAIKRTLLIAVNNIGHHRQNTLKIDRIEYIWIGFITKVRFFSPLHVNSWPFNKYVLSIICIFWKLKNSWRSQERYTNITPRFWMLLLQKEKCVQVLRIKHIHHILLSNAGYHLIYSAIKNKPQNYETPKLISKLQYVWPKTNNSNFLLYVEMAEAKTFVIALP